MHISSQNTLGKLKSQRVDPGTYGVDPASCELRAASLQAMKKSSLAPVGPILRAASCKLQALQAAKSKKSRASHLWCRSCELRAASCELPLQATKKSRSKVDPCTCEAAARQRCRLPAAAVGHHARTTSRVYGSRARHPDRDRARRYRVEAANSRVVGRGEHARSRARALRF